RGVDVPERGGRSITLRELAMHHSGLPRLPTNMHPAEPDNPFADYTIEQLYAFLSEYELPRDIGARYEYSNVGFGLLPATLRCSGRRGNAHGRRCPRSGSSPSSAAT